VIGAAPLVRKALDEPEFPSGVLRVTSFPRFGKPAGPSIRQVDFCHFRLAAVLACETADCTPRFSGRHGVPLAPEQVEGVPHY
jgi:hypothetical protein